MIIVIIISLLLFVVYAGLISGYYHAWHRMTFFDETGFTPAIKLSVIIPVRNEERVICRCIDSLKAQSVPMDHFEVIVVDDHSTDGTWGVLQNIDAGGMHLIRLKLADHAGARRKTIAFKKL
ncbi:MAG TPA: glycosyltransferase, partial [Puia sp.]|nr:glycosyltransferase [Puia sp.]